MRTSIGNYLLCVNGSITISFLTTKNTKRDEQREEPEESSLPLTVLGRQSTVAGLQKRRQEKEKMPKMS
jgi:hypothetical protein